MSFTTAIATLVAATGLDADSSWAAPLVGIGVLGLIGTAVCLWLYWKAPQPPTPYDGLAALAEKRERERAAEKERFTPYERRETTARDEQTTTRGTRTSLAAGRTPP